MREKYKRKKVGEIFEKNKRLGEKGTRKEHTFSYASAIYQDACSVAGQSFPQVEEAASRNTAQNAASEISGSGAVSEGEGNVFSPYHI